METKEYYEINLPGYLQHDLDAMKEGKWPYDCLWGELYGSINCAFVDGDITEDHAWYLREKYLDMERVRFSDKVDSKWTQGNLK
ncbi:hypothetical protein [Mediterraneibacter gnavus]|uniref:hypothetical protein n=1 Tax=Mediterraneibacter gnavus TaxID=33038 RepID=UPI00232F13EA|nr:hypothetical protein [Mediterraneibacter gnavus]MDB8703368.1 hypothetical protein [Mediterraneibacter gnavus]MDB8710716.1 hypothetical protein [Mediterraneibacter gnavus]MDB8713217.1 hypothetical protein [Mediterraneibacter gnavus]MDB8715753.1 hypothetical protein [Mediterraneibacter gnavus]